MTNFKPRKTVYKGIEMRSRLEAGFAQWLDERLVSWEYEPCAFGGEGGQYLPDFRIQLATQGEIVTSYVEVKPRQPDAGGLMRLIDRQPDESLTISHLGRQMSVVWESDPDAVLLLVWPGLVDVDTGAPAVLRLVTFTDRPGGDRTGQIFMPWVWTAGRTIGIARTLRRGPWPDGYWQVQ